MDLQGWMTRFHLLANRLIESWMDLVPDLTINDATVIATIAERRALHDEQQQNLAGIAAATPGAASSRCCALDRRDVEIGTSKLECSEKDSTETAVSFE